MPLGMEVGLGPGNFVLNGDPAHPINFRPMFIIVIVISLEHYTGVRRYWFVQVQVQYSVHSIFRKFNRIQYVRYAQLPSNFQPMSFVAKRLDGSRWYLDQAAP